MSLADLTDKQLRKMLRDAYQRGWWAGRHDATATIVKEVREQLLKEGKRVSNPQ